MKKNLFTSDTTKKMAELSKLTIEKKEESYFTKQFNETIKTIELLNELDTNKVGGTYHVTGLRNVFREDEIDKKRVLTQEEALSNGKRTYKGYFVVKGVLDEK